MANLFPMHLGKKEGFKGVKTEMSVKMVRFCKVCLRLGCVFRTAFYGRRVRNSALEVGLLYDSDLSRLPVGKG